MIVILIVILGCYGYIVYQREVSHFNDDMTNDALMLGKSIAGPIEHICKQSGIDLVLELIRDANQEEHQMKLRWIWLDRRTDELNPSKLSLNLINQVIKGQSVSIIAEDDAGEAFRFTYIPINLDLNRQGALEIAESLQRMKQYTLNSSIHLVCTGILLLIVFGWILWHRFQIWIHLPLQQLIEKTVKIGEGDLRPDLVIKARDEFSLLAETFNDMCRNLDATLKTIRFEHKKNIATLEQLRHTEKLATLGRLSAGVAHELGTPLNIICGRSKLIRKGPLETLEEQHDVVENARIIGEQANRMTQIIRGLLDFARRRHSKRQLKDIGRVVRKVLEMLRSTALKAKVSLLLEEKEKLPMIFIDSAQIHQVLTNLIMNGIQAMPDGGSLFLTLSVVRTQPPDAQSVDKDYLVIQVEDEGQGIPEENMEHLFEPFFTTKDVGQGTGLGLSIVLGLVKEHDGWIHVENRPEGGARFTVFLPVDCHNE